MIYLIAHAAWDPARKDSLRRMTGNFNAVVISSERREHASVWARRIWERASREDYHAVILNDDVTVPEDFDDICRAMTKVVPDQVISLHGSSTALAQVQGPWARQYHLTGPGYILPPGAAASLLDFSSSMPWSWVSSVNEDELAAQWMWRNQRPAWVALPSPVTHDTTVPSTLGYDQQPERTAAQPWTNEYGVTNWRHDGDPPFIECSWNPVARIAHIDRVLRLSHLCGMCQLQEGAVANPRTGVWVCRMCISLSTQALETK